MMNFCTSLDSNYLIKGLAMYKSLERYSDDFHLYIYAFDDQSCEILRKLLLQKATIISLGEFENKELKSIKNSRTKAEYFWTTTPFIIQHSIEKYNLDMCTYIDADIFFFDSPKTLLEELGNKSTLIVEHRYHPAHDKTEKIGKYCVQFNTFKNNELGMRTLLWWKNACADWCYARTEDGKFGDQKYLDDWPQRFTDVHELQHLGGGVAPWNVARYQLSQKNQKIFIKEGEQEFPLIFYHFHNTKLYKILGRVKTKSYFAINKRRDLQKLIYSKYENCLSSALKEIKSINPEFNNGFDKKINYLKKEIREIIPSFIKKVAKRMVNTY